MVIGLLIILLLVLFLPFTKVVEDNLELFLFNMGLLSVLVSQMLDIALLKQAFMTPINITLAVLIAGLIFRWLRQSMEVGLLTILEKLPFRLFIFLLVMTLGILSSIITAIISAIILAAIAPLLPLERSSKVRLVILACYSIGIGAALTPIGEPLSTIVVGKLGVDFFYLFRLIGPSVLCLLLIFGLIAAVLIKRDSRENRHSYSRENMEESYREIFLRSGKIYLFVMALTFLGAGFEPFIDRYLIDLSPEILYWFNMLSAVLDNATLAAAEISPAMDDATIQAILMGLLISGGMLIPGNIPNIIASGKLKITSLEYAKFAFPVGLLTMIGYFLIILLRP